MPKEAGVKYVMSFVHPVTTKKLDAYRKVARKFAKIWIEHGALEVYECSGDNLKPGKLTSFPQAVQAKRTETVVVSWVTFKSRAQSQRVMDKFMNDPRAQKLMNPTDLPSDGHRMFYGGFDVMIKL